MNDNLNPLESIQEIKAYMQKSSRFLSLSGWSGIWVGICGVISGSLAAYLLRTSSEIYRNLYNDGNNTYVRIMEDDLSIKLLFLAMITFLVAIFGGFFFSMRKARKEGIPFVNHIFRRMVINFSVPLITGGFVCLALLIYNRIAFIAPFTLIFYGLSLWGIARDTLDEVKKLAFFEIILGIVSLFLLRYFIVFWIIGFGFLHIIYGIIMRNKYERK